MSNIDWPFASYVHCIGLSYLIVECEQNCRAVSTFGHTEKVKKQQITEMNEWIDEAARFGYRRIHASIRNPTWPI